MIFDLYAVVSNVSVKCAHNLIRYFPIRSSSYVVCVCNHYCKTNKNCSLMMGLKIIFLVFTTLFILILFLFLWWWVWKWWIWVRVIWYVPLSILLWLNGRILWNWFVRFSILLWWNGEMPWKFCWSCQWRSIIFPLKILSFSHSFKITFRIYLFALCSRFDHFVRCSFFNIMSMPDPFEDNS